jgi:hypothetical protein
MRNSYQGLCFLLLPYFLIHLACDRKYYNNEKRKKDHEILKGLDIFRSPDYENVVSGTPSVCPFVCMDVHLATASTVGRVLFIFSVQECIHFRSVAYNSSSKIRGDFLEKGSNNSD